MGTHCYHFLQLVTLLLICTSVFCLRDNHHHPHRLNRTDKVRAKRLANPTDVICATAKNYKYDTCPNPGDLCGIDKATGEVQGCVPASQCPSGTGKTLSCDPTKPSCCCRTTQAEIEANDDVPCNAVWDTDVSSKCKQACTLPELKNFDFCTIKLTDRVWCVSENDDGSKEESDCFANKFCGIQRTTGRLQGCVTAFECPSSAKGSKAITCDPTKPSCCCQQITHEDEDYPDVDCNHIKSLDYPSVRQQACKLPELSSLALCKADSTKRLYCSNQFQGDYEPVVDTYPWEMCGINKISGEVQASLDPTKCPASAKGSSKIVCDGSSPFCCCQKLVNPGDNSQSCNDILNEKDSTIWRQACGLPQLSSLAICQEDPSKRVSCAYGAHASSAQMEKCKPSEMCGIDKANGGAMEKCVDPKKCPAGAKGSEKVVCDDKASFCCCQKLEGKLDSSQNPCNYYLNDRDDKIWKQACALPQLSSLPKCQENPSKEVLCLGESRPGSGVYNGQCSPYFMCGIDKTNGRLEGCVDPSQCPAGAKNSDSIVCDDKAPSCCCQNLDDIHGPKHVCNDLLNDRDSSKWKQACSLAQLEDLDICQHDPAKRVYCRTSKGNTEECKTSEFCGIDKKNGRMKRCLDSSKCPHYAKDSIDIVCDDSVPYCCCQKDDDFGDDDQPCNNILDEKDNSIWQQACGLYQLSGLAVCKEDPTKRVYCNYQDNGQVITKGCRLSEFCGIDKKDGEMRNCVDKGRCPDEARGSEKIVCDDSAPYCCCQKEDKVGEDDNPCNDILNSNIWKQACKLPELLGLEVCKRDPSEKKPGDKTDSKSGSGQEDEDGDLETGEIVGIVAGVLIALLLIGGLIFFCFFKKKNEQGDAGEASKVPTESTVAVVKASPVQVQPPPSSQPPIAPPAQKLPVGYFPVQKGYPYPASQSVQFAPVGQANQRPNTVSMPNMRS